MPSAKLILFVLLGLLAAAFASVWMAALRRTGRLTAPSLYQLTIGFVASFLDTLGVGSFATTTAVYRMRKSALNCCRTCTLSPGLILAC